MSAVANVLWQVVAPIFLIVSVGYVLARKLALSPRELSRAAFYFFSPCLLFDKLSQTTLSPVDLGRLAAFALLTMAGCGLLAWLLSRAAGYDQQLTSAFILVSFAGNTGNYGLPASQFAFGPAALEPAVIYYAISTLVISTVGVYLAARGRQTAGLALRNVLRVPLVYAGLAGLVFWAARWQAPVPVARAVSVAGQGAIPVMLLILGVQLAGVRLREAAGPIALATLTKLVGGALLGVFLAGLLGLSGLTRQVSILQAAMPTAVMTTVLATEYDAAPDFTAGVVLTSTLASLLTVTLLLTYLR